jgi:hypothetical protein
MTALPGLAGRDVRLRYPALADVLGSCPVKAQIPVRPAPGHGTVVIVLAVILPLALVADLLVASFRQGRVAAAWAGVRDIARRGVDVLQRDVAVEPLLPSADQFVVWYRRIVMGAAPDGTMSQRVTLHRSVGSGEVVSGLRIRP